MKVGCGESQYNYGRTTAFNESIATLKDIKKSIEAAEKREKIENNIKKKPLDPIIIKEQDWIQTV